jgi:hypothetical protein
VSHDERRVAIALSTGVVLAFEAPLPSDREVQTAVDAAQ